MKAAQKIKSMSIYLFKTCYLQLIISAAVLLFNFIIALTIFHSTDGKTGSGNPDGTVIIWGLILGMVLFGTTFKFALVNGVSRRSFYVSSIIVMAVMAAAWSVIGSAFILVSDALAKTFTLYSLYKSGVFGMFVWLFFAVFAFELFGWMVIQLFRRFGPSRMIIAGAGIVVLAGLLTLINVLVDGGMLRAIGKFFLSVTGFGGKKPNPYICVAAFTVFGAICAGISYLLVRRAPIKE